ncbi:MAG: DUF4091 domain-containing protein [Clostridia bacterium]|nr:DUF4091 domain-containing protein [Clostridia bacterium]
MVKFKIVSSLEKPFWDMTPEQFPTLSRISALRGERVSFQVLTHSDTLSNGWLPRSLLTPTAKGALADFVEYRTVNNVPVDLPVNYALYDDQYLRTTPGLYPDRLQPLTYGGKVFYRMNYLFAVWVDVTIPKDTDIKGETTLTLTFANEGESYTVSIVIDVIPAELPEQTLMLTQWFHCDCLAQYYRVPVWSEEHWRIVENFARVAYKNGINMLLTPTFTPPLDTEIGGERLTTQLVGVTVENGKYSFDFSLVDRWVEMCDRIGIKYFEIAHLFTQWGAKHAPKVMATVNGEYKRIFGWETEATGEEYSTFLRQFIPAFIEHMKKNGNDKRCFFHISDEPQLEQLESYKAAKAVVADMLEGYTIMDALSNYEFYEQGLVKTPIPANNHIKPFIENKVENLWTYYCCGQCIKVSNRLIAMPAWRNRSIGMQMFKYDIVGFLQWGYNFYNNFYSIDAVNPYADSNGEYWVPAGDTYSVYPGEDGNALESTRILVFHEGLQDISAMKLCASLYSKEEVVKAIEDILGEELTFDRCAYTSQEMLCIREKINAMIKARV